MDQMKKKRVVLVLAITIFVAISSIGCGRNNSAGSIHFESSSVQVESDTGRPSEAMTDRDIVSQTVSGIGDLVENINSGMTASQEEDSMPDVIDHLRAVGDVYGDGMTETLTLRDFDGLGTSAALWIDNTKVMDLKGQGELSEYTCRLVTTDLDEDNQDEVLVLINVAAAINDASLRCIKWSGNGWIEQKVPLPKLEITLDDDWQCMLSDATEKQVIEVKNPALRDKWFDELGVPFAGTVEVGTFTECADHKIENRKIYFNACVTVRGVSEDGMGDVDIWEESMVMISSKNGQLVTDNALYLTLLNILTDPGL